ncbi:MAG: LemA family protein [Nitriliruptoraceae bacterium]|nr:LemA family protein [Nitriliruptoraceae bacterium]
METILTLLVLVGLPLLLVIWSYNRFVGQATSIDATWATIDTELQRRHDLVPNLVATVQGYAAHEQQVLAQVTEARAAAIRAAPEDVPLEQQARAEDALTSGLSSLLAVSESYPELKADSVFRDLQRQLIETEDRISASRRLYNIEVASYERRRRSVPSNLIAGAFGFGPRTMFEIQDAAAQHAAQVGFPRASGGSAADADGAAR